MIGNASENTNIIYVNVPTNLMHHKGAELTWQANSKKNGRGEQLKQQ